MALGLAVMYVVMFSMIDGWGDYRNNLNMFYMAVTMWAPMGIFMLATMAGMYPSKQINLALYILFAVLTAGSFWATREQALIDDRRFRSRAHSALWRDYRGATSGNRADGADYRQVAVGCAAWGVFEPPLHGSTMPVCPITIRSHNSAPPSAAETVGHSASGSRIGSFTYSQSVRPAPAKRHSLRPSFVRTWRRAGASVSSIRTAI
jgi:hypothetical protein